MHPSVAYSTGAWLRDVTRLIEKRSDDELGALMTNLGGHDLPALTEAFNAIDHDRLIGRIGRLRRIDRVCRGIGFVELAGFGAGGVGRFVLGLGLAQAELREEVGVDVTELGG